jgi:hypothetical protein
MGFVGITLFAVGATLLGLSGGVGIVAGAGWLGLLAGAAVSVTILVRGPLRRRSTEG